MLKLNKNIKKVFKKKYQDWIGFGGISSNGAACRCPAVSR